MLDIALEIPLAALGFGRFRKCHIARGAGVHELPDRKDRAPFTRGISAFKDTDYPPASALQPILQLDQFDLKPLKRFFIIF